MRKNVLGLHFTKRQQIQMRMDSRKVMHAKRMKHFRKSVESMTPRAIALRAKETPRTQPRYLDTSRFKQSATSSIAEGTPATKTFADTGKSSDLRSFVNSKPAPPGTTARPAEPPPEGAYRLLNARARESHAHAQSEQKAHESRFNAMRSPFLEVISQKSSTLNPKDGFSFHSAAVFARKAGEQKATLPGPVQPKPKGALNAQLGRVLTKGGTAQGQARRFTELVKSQSTAQPSFPRVLGPSPAFTAAKF